MNNVFGLDIGTRNVIGTVGYRTDNDEFIVVAQYIKQHDTRAMLDGQIHDIGKVAKTISVVKRELEQQIGQPLTEVCIAAAGRVLKTVTTHVEYEYAEETVVTGEDIHTLNLLGIEKAQESLKTTNDTKYKFYCVGYSVVKYYLNDEPFISIQDHKANKIGEDVIVTFLPEDVVDGLYSAVGHADLTVANMTLEPIAAINVAIPENFRMLNIALVDVGAGTSDISITKDGSIIAYGMIPYAGDELTEVIVQHYLVDFKTAEEMKLASTEADEVTYKDIMSITHTIPSSDIWKVVEPVVEKITSEVGAKIMELNGDKSVSACFVVGGGGKIHGFTEALAKKLDLPEERVALRGEEVLGEVTFQQEDIKKDPLLVTPIGICLNYYEQRNNFIMVRFNGERLKLYDNNRLTIVDAALQAGFPNDQLFPKRGMPINFTVNGAARIARGEAGEAAIVRMNGNPANINTPLEPNSEITIEPSTSGAAARYTIGQLEECRQATLTFNINGKDVVCPKFVQVNGSLEPASYEIQEGDEIETRNFYTVGQIAEFMDIVIDEDQEILVNNREADLNTLVYENFSIEWVENPYGVRSAQYSSNYSNLDEVTENSIDEEQLSATQDEMVQSEGAQDEIAQDETMQNETIQNEMARGEKTQDEASQVGVSQNEVQVEENDNSVIIVVTVNGEAVELSGKESYIFVDIFDRITFDLQAGRGRAIATLINGREAQFSEELHDGDKIELYWKEN
ncbi:MAG: cell division FtsA domain-containing protein [Agathobacter sp.]|nr:cell division FtsA domain-containing protein [Agathobacter sp.]